MPRHLKLQIVQHLYSQIVWSQVKSVMLDGEAGIDSATWREFLGFAQRRWGWFN